LIEQGFNRDLVLFNICIALAADYQPGFDWDLIWIVMLTLLNGFFMDQKSTHADWVNVMEETMDLPLVEI